MKTFCCQTFLLIVLLVFSFNVYAQTDSLKIDSLKKVLVTQKEDTNKVNTLNELANNIDDLKFVMLYAKEAYSLAQKINFKRGEGIASWNIGYVHFHHKDYISALKFDNIFLKAMQDINDLKEVCNAYRAIGESYAMQNNRPEALKNYLQGLDAAKRSGEKSALIAMYWTMNAYYYDDGNYAEAIKNSYLALKLSQEKGDKYSIAWSFDNLTNAYSAQGNYHEALKTSLAALEVFKEINDIRGIARCHLNIGEQYFQMKNYSRALEEYFYALKLYEEWEKSGDRGDMQDISYTRNDIAAVYEKQGEIALAARNKDFSLQNFAEAKKNYLGAIKLFNTTDKFNSANAYFHLANISIKLNNLPEAEDYLEKGMQLAKEIGNKEAIKNGYAYKTALDSMHKNYKQAYEDYKTYILYRDSLVNEESTKKSLQSQIQYEFDKKQAVAKAAQDKKDAESKRIKNQQYFIITSLGIIVLAVVIIALIQFRNNKHKQKANIALQHQKEKVETTLIELKATQSQLIQSEKMASLGELTAGIAHEIQNPLNFVNNFSEVNNELIEEMNDENDLNEIKAIANDIKQNNEKISFHGKRADAIVKGMLQHSKQTTGVKEPTDINALCDEYLRLSYHGMHAKDKNFNADFKTDFDETIGKINIVPQDIGRVLLNLYNNAFYATNEKKKTADESYKPLVTVRTLKNPPPGGRGAGIIVSDNGNGIPQNIIDKIFQPFFTTKPTGEGTGLGLSLGYDIIKAHGGEIKVETLPAGEAGKEGEGSEFIIKLPIV